MTTAGDSRRLPKDAIRNERNREEPGAFDPRPTPDPASSRPQIPKSTPHRPHIAPEIALDLARSFWGRSGSDLRLPWGRFGAVWARCLGVHLGPVCGSIWADLGWVYRSRVERGGSGMDMSRSGVDLGTSPPQRAQIAPGSAPNRPQIDHWPTQSRPELDTGSTPNPRN